MPDADAGSTQTSSDKKKRRSLRKSAAGGQWRRSTSGRCIPCAWPLAARSIGSLLIFLPLDLSPREGTKNSERIFLNNQNGPGCNRQATYIQLKGEEGGAPASSHACPQPTSDLRGNARSRWAAASVHFELCVVGRARKRDQRSRRNGLPLYWRERRTARGCICWGRCKEPSFWGTQGGHELTSAASV